MSSFSKSFWREPVWLVTFTLPCVGDSVNLGKCISSIYTWSLALVGLAAFLSIVYGGWLVVTAFGNTGKVSEATMRITNGVLGIILLFSSYLILRTINPDLVGGTIRLPKITKEDKIKDIDSTGNTLTKIEAFDVKPSVGQVADISDNTELTFTLKIFSSTSNFERACKVAGSTSSPTDVRPEYRVFFLNRPNATKPGELVQSERFNKSVFGEGGKAVDFTFKKKIKDLPFDPSSGNNVGQFYAVFLCYDGGKSPQLNESSPPISVRIVP